MTPSACSRRTASRTVWRLTPYWARSSSSPGNRPVNSPRASRARRSPSTCAHSGIGLLRSRLTLPVCGRPGRFGRLPTVPGPPLPAYVVMRSHHDVLVCSVPGRGCACLCGLVPAGGEGPGQGHGRYGDCVLALLLVALSLGLSNFAAAVGIGVSGVDARTRL